MKTQDKNDEKAQAPARDKTSEDIRKSEKDLGPHTNMRPDRETEEERFPESNMSKDQREDAEHVEKKRQEPNQDSSDIQQLADDVEGTVGSRVTSSSPDDIAGVADLDRGMRRAKRRQGT